MFSANNIKKILSILLCISVCINIYFIAKKDDTLTPEKIGTTVFRASRNCNLDFLNTVVWERESGYWRNKLNTAYGKGSNGMNLRSFVAIMYDNGNTLIVELGEDLKNNVKAADMFFLENCKEYPDNIAYLQIP